MVLTASYAVKIPATRFPPHTDIFPSSVRWLRMVVVEGLFREDTVPVENYFKSFPWFGFPPTEGEQTRTEVIAN